MNISLQWQGKLTHSVLRYVTGSNLVDGAANASTTDIVEQYDINIAKSMRNCPIVVLILVVKFIILLKVEIFAIG